MRPRYSNGLTPHPACFHRFTMDRARKGGWVYIMADRYRGTLYVGVTSDLSARVHQHKSGEGSDFCARKLRATFRPSQSPKRSVTALSIASKARFRHPFFADS